MNTIYNKYNSIVPSAMTQRELLSMCADLQTCKNWGLKTCTVHLVPVGMDYKVDVADIQDYRNELKIQTGR